MTQPVWLGNYRPYGPKLAIFVRCDNEENYDRPVAMVELPMPWPELPFSGDKWACCDTWSWIEARITKREFYLNGDMALTIRRDDIAKWYAHLRDVHDFMVTGKDWESGRK